MTTASPGTPHQPLTLAGRLLVATPRLGDPNFDGTVVLLLDHDESGTLGVVVNRPSELAVADVIPPWGEHVSLPRVLFEGGPVAKDNALALASLAGPGADDGLDAAPEAAEPVGFRRVRGRLGLVDLDAPPELVVPGLMGLRIFAGYAGWGPGQLLAELDEGAWYVVDPEPADLFGDAPGRLWRGVLRRQVGDLALVSTHASDPSQN